MAEAFTMPTRYDYREGNLLGIGKACSEMPPPSGQGGGGAFGYGYGNADGGGDGFGAGEGQPFNDVIIAVESRMSMFHS